MGTIYRVNLKPKWRVIIRHKGYKTITKYFDLKEEAQRWNCEEEKKYEEFKLKESLKAKNA